LLDVSSPFVTTLKVGRATPKRAVSFAVERFVVEPTGWIGNTLEEGGDLIVWESGEADAAWATPADLEGPKPEPSYFEHWDGLTAGQFDTAFAAFTCYFRQREL
jgi:hypothetical protein